jgi:hypothetical protein
MAAFVPQFLLLLQFGAFSFRLFGLKGPDGCGRDTHSRGDQESPLRGNGWQNAFERLHGRKSSDWGLEWAEYQQHRRTERLRESCASRLGIYNKVYKIRVAFGFLVLVLMEIQKLVSCERATLQQDYEHNRWGEGCPSFFTVLSHDQRAAVLVVCRSDS